MASRCASTRPAGIGHQHADRAPARSRRETCACYLVAGTGERQHTFGWDRVISIGPTGMPAARATADPDLGGPLRWSFGKDLQVGDAHPDGRVDVVLTGQSPQVLAWRLAGFGKGILVLDPPETCQHLTEIGTRARRRVLELDLSTST